MEDYFNALILKVVHHPLFDVAVYALGLLSAAALLAKEASDFKWFVVSCFVLIASVGGTIESLVKWRSGVKVVAAAAVAEQVKKQVVKLTPFAEVVTPGSTAVWPWTHHLKASITSIRAITNVGHGIRIRVHHGEAVWEFDARAAITFGQGLDVYADTTTDRKLAIEVVNLKGEPIAGVELAVTGVYVDEVKPASCPVCKAPPGEPCDGGLHC